MDVIKNPLDRLTPDDLDHIHQVMARTNMDYAAIAAWAILQTKPTYVISPFTQTLILCPETGAVYDRHEAQERLFWLIGQATAPVIGDTLAEVYVRQIGDLVRAMRQLKEEE